MFKIDFWKLDGSRLDEFWNKIWKFLELLYLKMNDWKGNFLEKNCAHRDEMEELSKRYIYR